MNGPGGYDLCPCCGATASASQHAELRYACDVCGGPRVPRLDRSLRYGGREVPLLRKADAARKARAGWRFAAIAVGLLLPFIIMVFGVFLLLFSANAVLLLVSLFVTAPIAAFVVFAFLRAAARGHEIAPALDAAWLAVATDIAQQTRGLTAPALAEKLGIEEPQAEELMALVDVNAAVSAPRPQRARIDVQSPGITQLSPDVQAEEEALAERIEAAAREGAVARPDPGAAKP